jgi:periodic tryptophan protein 2
MRFNYKLHRLCGAYYGNPTATDSYGSNGASGGTGSGSNLIYTSTGNALISSVSNRIQVIDLRTHTVRTLPIEARSNIACIALSPDDSLLIVVDVKNYAMLINFTRGVVLHRFQFSQSVRHLIFSPCGQYIAVTHGKHVQVWYTPNQLRKEFSPMVLHRTYTGQSNTVVRLAFSSDSSVLIATSRDGTARIWTVHTTRDYQPVTLSGHKTKVIGAYFTYMTDDGSNRIDSCYTVSEDGALVTWKATYPQDTSDDQTLKEDIDLPPKDNFEAQVDEALDFFSGGGPVSSTTPKIKATATTDSALASSKSQAHHLVNATWSAHNRHFFHQEGARAITTTYCTKAQLLAIGFSSGIFGIYELPSVANIHTLSVGSNQLIQSCTLNNTGEWLALGCPASQQLLVWEWRSESYVLKQRGHAYGMRCMAYSPDGVVVCTGGEDGKIKLWNASSGFCYVTLEKNHTAPVTAVCFANSSVVLSASLDGTVRAHDLHRYRTFRTLTTPTPVQFVSLAVDPAGEVVTAGTLDPFHIYAWNLQTGRLLDVLTGHQGPVCGLTYQTSAGGALVSASWDGTVKLWDLYKQKDGNSVVPSESMSHNSDVVCVACRPDGKELCSGTIGGLLSFWDVEHAKLKFEIDGRRDIAGGRKINDRMTSDNNASSRYFTSICYSADGSYLLAGGNSKYVCIYEISQQVLLKKFQVTFNRSLDGVLDEVRYQLTCMSFPVVNMDFTPEREEL